MKTDIYMDDEFAGLDVIMVDDEGTAYEIMALKSDICDNVLSLARLEKQLNVERREGYRIYPLRDNFGKYVWCDWEKRLVLCLGEGLWG